MVTSCQEDEGTDTQNNFLTIDLSEDEDLDDR